MSVSKTITVVCDYKNCKGTNNGPATLSWNETAVSNGQAEPPEEAKYIVSFSQATTSGNRLFSFCCQLHAAEFFLPPGYEAKQKQVIQLPSNGPISQADGESEENPDNGQCPKCPHPVQLHNEWGCTIVMSNRPGDFCLCNELGPAPVETA